MEAADAWADFCDRLKAVGSSICGEDFPSSPQERANGFRHLGGLVVHAVFSGLPTELTMLFGELDGARSPRLERLLEACRAAGFQATLSDHIEVDIWSKFVRLSVLSGMTSVTRSPIGPLRIELGFPLNAQTGDQVQRIQFSFGGPP